MTDQPAAAGRWRGGAALAQAGLGVLCLLVSLLVQRHGIGLMGDTSRFFDYGSRPGLGELPVHDAPLYPLLLRLHLLTGVSVRDFAAGVSTAFFIGTTLLLFAAVRAAGRSVLAATAAAAVTMFSWPMVSAFAHAQTEVLFLPLMLASLALLVREDHPRCTLLIALSGLAALLGILTRYAGAFMVPAGLLTLLLLAGWRAPRRLLAGWAVFLITTAGPVALWLLFNRLRSGTATSRVLAVHFPTPDKLEGGLYWILNFLLPYRVIERAPGLATAAVVALIGLSVILLRRHGTVGEQRLACGGLVWSVAYLAFLFASLTLFDDHTPLDARVLGPLALLLLPVVALAVGITVVRERNRPLRALAALGLLYLVLFTAQRGHSFVRTARREGIGFARAVVRESPALREAVQLARRFRVYANAPEAAWLLHDCRDLLGIPYKISPTSLQPSPGFDDQMAALRAEVQSGRAVVAVFYFKHDPVVWTHYLPTIAEMTDRLGAVPLRTYPDGLLLGADSARAEVEAALTAVPPAASRAP